MDAWLPLCLSVCARLEHLVLDVVFENPGLALALPAGLLFGGLERLVLQPGDLAAVKLCAELLSCVESPRLRYLEIETVAITEELVSALCHTVSAVSGTLLALKVWWAPTLALTSKYSELSAPYSFLRLLERMPSVECLGLGLASAFRGVGLERSLAPIQPPLVSLPGTNPLLANMVLLTKLRELTFDYLADDVLRCLTDLSDRSLCLSRASFSGVSKFIQDPDEALALLLTKLGDGLEEFILMVDVDVAMRPFYSGVLRNRVGAVPALWEGRVALKYLALNWTAFDDDGVHCIAENCPELHTLLLERAEYWTDAVALTVVDLLPHMRRFRVRPSSMMSDQCLYTLAEAAERFSVLEIEPSLLMSTFALDNLRQKLAPLGGAEGNVAASSLEHLPLDWIAAASDAFADVSSGEPPALFPKASAHGVGNDLTAGDVAAITEGSLIVLEPEKCSGSLRLPQRMRRLSIDR